MKGAIGKRAAESARRGVTLLELLVVMLLISIVLGFGLGMFASVDPGQRAALGLVQNVLRKAVNSAVSRSATARVRIQPGGAGFSAEVLRTVGTWHFEEQGALRGAFGMNGTLDGGGELVAEGWQGHGLSFLGDKRRARVGFGLAGRPEWDLGRGFVVELALRLEQAAGARVLAIGESFQLEVGAAGELAASFLAETRDSGGRPQPGGRVTLRAERGSLELGRWHHLRVGYDRRLFWAEIDRVRVAELSADVPVYPIEGDLVLSGGDQPLPGTIDALVVSVVDAEERAQLPAGVLFAPDAPSEVVFEPGGMLDRDVHAEPLAIALDFPGGRRLVVRVELYGTVQ